MRRASFFLVATASLSLIVAGACNSSKSSNESAVVNKSSGSPNQLTGAGSTFVYPIMTRWVQNFSQANQGIQINYQSIGSGGGIQQLKKGLVDFGASDAALDDKALAEFSSPIVQIPESAGPVCITYNLPNLKSPLKLSAAALSGIFMGTIKKWHDPAITKTNPGAQLPDTDIVVAHRSDGSGTSNIFTTYLSAVNKDWADKVGKGTSVKWPVGLGGKGSEGVTGIVKQTEGAIGYVELTYADENKLPVAAIENQAHQFVAPSAEGSSAAIDAFSSELAKDVRTPIVNPPATAKDAYPISGLTFLLIPKQGSNPEKQANVKKFVQYILADGQSIASGLHYSPLPKSIVEIDNKLLSDVK